jgi:hypothetical protein
MWDAMVGLLRTIKQLRLATTAQNFHVRSFIERHTYCLNPECKHRAAAHHMGYYRVRIASLRRAGISCAVDGCPCEAFVDD